MNDYAQALNIMQQAAEQAPLTKQNHINVEMAMLKLKELVDAEAKRGEVAKTVADNIQNAIS